MKLSDRDNGYAAMTKRLWGFRRPRIAVGILSGRGAEADHVGRVRATVLDVAIWNEFGTSRIPARSFIRAWFDENEARLRDDLLVLMHAVIRGEQTKERALELLALKCVGEIQQRIADGIEPPNAPSTVARKGSSKPLIDSGQLRAMITSRVEPG